MDDHTDPLLEEPTRREESIVTVCHEPTIGAISLKIPLFWVADPHIIWFAQVKAQFSTRGISSEKTKFEHIVASLAPEYAQEVRDLILSPPSTTPYTTLKTQLIQCTATSLQQRLQQLFCSEDLGDRKPTQLLRRMQQLMGEDVRSADDPLIKELFLHLSSNVRIVLASTGTKDLQALAQLADKVMEVAAPTVSAIRAGNSSPDIVQLRSEVADLRKMFETFMSTKPSSHSRTPTRG